jgi:NAD(P)-dependent dehydrogenase (short-subunit alcohol dehydrogenase family)
MSDPDNKVAHRHRRLTRHRGRDCRASGQGRLHRRHQLFRRCRSGRGAGPGNRSRGGKALTAKADVSDADAVRRMFDAAEAAFGGVDVLVNNAGIMMLSSLTEATMPMFDRQISVNLKGTFNTLREAANGCATAAGSSISRPAWSVSSSKPTVSTPPPRPLSKR